ncbi:MAG: diguanylate cyclase [Desulfosporosinus sp. BICA1-9]|nr:MAG: diguanylate cyclase [Desulfosporosinus sp. BICA1-9]
MTGNVMIVDDSPIDRKIISQILKERLGGISVFESEDGRNIYQKLVLNNIQMCILDIVMPHKNGYQILEEMKNNPDLMDIPVIVCTGIEDKQAIEKALTLGAYDYFSKPFTQEAMKISLPLKVKNAIEFMKRKEEIIYLSYHDKLTSLYNRRFFEEVMIKFDTERNLPISIIMGDVNGLKLVNDAFGHEKGDELLQKAAAAIQNSCRKDEIVARWGGDEFVILMTKTKAEDIERVINRIKKSYSGEYVNSLSVSVSFGWSTKSKANEDILKVLKSAEDLMYKHKTIENQGIRSNTINTIINTLHEKSPREEQHSKRVSEICQNIGKAMDFSEIEQSILKAVGLLHDIGKIAIDDSILNKPGKLTEQEWEEIKRHPDIGYRILSTSYDFLELADCILAHHEKWAGTGYPKGLKGEDIPRIARIIAIADSYDAMTSERPYRKAMSEEEACIEIRKNSGTQFDPKIARIFIEKVLGMGWHYSVCEQFRTT